MLVGRDADERLVPEPEQGDRLVDRRVRLLGAIDANAADPASSGEAMDAHTRDRCLTRRGKRMERRDRRRVVNDSLEFGGQSEELAQPAE
jgi:hypothetical protein